MAAGKVKNLPKADIVQVVGTPGFEKAPDPKTHPRWPKTGPTNHKTALDSVKTGSRQVQGAPREVPRRSPRSPKRAHDRPKTGVRQPQDSPRTAHDQPQNSPRRPQKTEESLAQDRHFQPPFQLSLCKCDIMGLPWAISELFCFVLRQP